MGRGKAWDLEENETLARAWIAASEDPIAGADQKAKVFFNTLHRRFIEKGPPPSKVLNGKYGFRSAESCRKHVADLSADVQKFNTALRKLRACGPTGVNEDQVLSMAVAIHMEVTNSMDYEHKDYVKENWLSFNAWKVWSRHPKWATAKPALSTTHSSAEAEATPTLTSPEQLRGALEEGSHDPCGVTRGGSAAKAEERFGLGTRSAKLIRQEELRTQAVRSMAESAKRKSDALEERNAIAVFSLPEAAGLPETSQFFAAIRQMYLSQALKKVRMEAHDAQTTRTVPTETLSDEAPVAAPETSGNTTDAPAETSN